MCPELYSVLRIMKTWTFENPTQVDAQWIQNASVKDLLRYYIFINQEKAVGLSQQLGWSPNYFSMLTSGRSKLSLAKIYPVADLLKIDPLLLRNKVMAEAQPEYFADEHKYLYSKKVFPMSVAIMERANQKGLKYGTLDAEQLRILDEAFRQIKELESKKKPEEKADSESKADS